MAEQNLTVAQVAERINYSSAQVRTLLREGKIKGTRAGDKGKWQISEDSVKSFVGVKTDKTQSEGSESGNGSEQEESQTTTITPPTPKTKSGEKSESEKSEGEKPAPATTTTKGNGSSNFPLGEAIQRFFRR